MLNLRAIRRKILNPVFTINAFGKKQLATKNISVLYEEWNERKGEMKEHVEIIILRQKERGTNTWISSSQP